MERKVEDIDYKLNLFLEEMVDVSHKISVRKVSLIAYNSSFYINGHAFLELSINKQKCMRLSPVQHEHKT